MDRPIKVTYSGSSNDYQGKETISLSVEIDNFDDYDDTLELLRLKVLEKLGFKQKHEELVSEYQAAREKFIEITEQLESANKQWELVRSFLKAQGLKSDTTEFPQEALTNLSKSLPATQSGYPE